MFILRKKTFFYSNQNRLTTQDNAEFNWNDHLYSNLFTRYNGIDQSKRN